jgi:hypothetical protein
MAKVTLELTENEARIFVRALNIAASYIDSGEPFDGILNKFKLTDEEVKSLRAKMQARHDEPIDWPPTDLHLIEYLSGALGSQLPE